ncbi:MAG: hypothetical protein OH324_03075 [Candidatus Parvarchaeota archaeon]|nr:hypothetical protein [Candidatus Rehaiarchaeum fermentans]
MKDAKTIYAQSSDIKSRTYLEYRKDMKKKAIVELEILHWIKNKFFSKNEKIIVEKYGGDKYIWFLRKGGITREPDFVIKYPDGKEEYLEFQYAEKVNHYDFKTSKITPKSKKIKKENTKILYLIKPSAKFAIISPEWIVNNSIKTVAAAWGNVPVYRVSKENFEKLFEEDKDLINVCDIIDKKIKILDFQHKAIDISKNQLSHLLQQVIDEKQIVKIIPNTLDGFFKVCFILDYLEKVPENVNLWLIYLLSYVDSKLNSYDIFRLIYCMDFLYSKTELKPNELNLFVDKLKILIQKIKSFEKNDGSYFSDKNISPLEDTRYCLFSINILEDLIQDLLFYYNNNLKLKPIQKIYEYVKDINKTYSFISS